MSLPRRLSGWLGLDPAADASWCNPPVPRSIERGWFALGAAPAYLLLVQVGTGILLALHYRPSADAAYDSVRAIVAEAPFGWYLRALHAWGATLLVATALLHQLRVLIHGAYRDGRAVNWLLGCALLAAVLSACLTGYGLVGDQRGYWGLTVAAHALADLPVVGGPLGELLAGGDSSRPPSIPRLFALHAAAVPAAMAALAVLHIALARLQRLRLSVAADGAADGSAPARAVRRFFPEQALTELAVVVALTLLLSALSSLLAPPLGPRADPLALPRTLQPEWTFYPASRWLGLLPRPAALGSMLVALAAMAGWPWIDRALRERTRASEPGVWVGLVAVLGLLGLTLWEAVLE